MLGRLLCRLGWHAWTYNGVELVQPVTVPRLFRYHYICRRCLKTRHETEREGVDAR